MNSVRWLALGLICIGAMIIIGIQFDRNEFSVSKAQR